MIKKIKKGFGLKKIKRLDAGIIGMWKKVILLWMSKI